MSLDRTGAGLGIERQEEECRQLAGRLGLTVEEVIADNDLSATTGKTRPGFEALLASKPESIVVWHTDRLIRVMRDLERVIELGVNVHALMAGHLNLSTPGGRAVARTLTAWATYEGEQRSERQQAAARQRARSGQSWWSRRPFGFELDGSLRDDEAAALRETYTDLLAGLPLTTLAKDLNGKGFQTNYGRPWTSTTLRPVLLAARNAGIRTYNGAEVGEGAWDAIVDVGTYRAAVALLTDPKRDTGGGGRLPTSLLTGIAVCGVCGGPVKAGQRNGKGGGKAGAPGSYPVYACRVRHCVTHRMEGLDAYIETLVKERLYRVDTAQEQVGEDEARAASEEAERLQRQLDDALRQYLTPAPGEDRLSAALLARVEAQIKPQLEAALRRSAGVRITSSVVENPELWDDMAVHERRDHIRSLHMKIELLPIGRGVRKGYRTADHVRVTNARTGAPWPS